MELPETMKAMVLQAPGELLVSREMPLPVPNPDQVLIKVHACGVCRTDLHVVDGELPDPKLPIIPGHEIVGSVVRKRTGWIPLSWGTESESPGWATPAVNAFIAAPAEKICVTSPSSPDTLSTADMRSTRLPIGDTVSHCGGLQ